MEKEMLNILKSFSQGIPAATAFLFLAYWIIRKYIVDNEKNNKKQDDRMTTLEINCKMCKENIEKRQTDLDRQVLEQIMELKSEFKVYAAKNDTIKAIAEILKIKEKVEK